MRATSVRQFATARRRNMAAPTVEIPEPQRARHSQPSTAALLEGLR